MNNEPEPPPEDRKAIEQLIHEARERWIRDSLLESPQCLTIPGIGHGNLGQPWKGIDPSIQGQHWVVPPGDLDQMDMRGGILWVDGAPYLGIPGLQFDPAEPAEIEHARQIVRAWLQRRLGTWDEEFVRWLFGKVVDTPDGPGRYSKLCRLAYQAAGEVEPDEATFAAPAELAATAELAEKACLERAFAVIKRHSHASLNIEELYAEEMTLFYALLGERAMGALLICERKALMKDFDLANLVGDAEELKRLLNLIVAVNDEVAESLDREQRLWAQCLAEDQEWIYNEVASVGEAAELMHPERRDAVMKLRQRRML